MTTPALECKLCGVPLHDSNMDRIGGIVRCSSCHSVVSLPGSATAKRASSPVSMPAHMHMLYDRGELTIAWRWYRLQFVNLVTIIAAIFLALIFVDFGRDSGLFLLCGVGAILILGYWALALFLNTTYLFVNAKKVELVITPVPWVFSHMSLHEPVSQVYVKAVAHESKNGKTYTYDVYCFGSQSRRHIKVLRGFKKVEHALYIEQEVERFLGIHDVVVPGEVRDHGA